MTFLNKLQDHMISHIAKAIVGLAVFLFGYKYNYLPLGISAYIKEIIPQQELQGTLLSIFLILLILSIVYLLFRNNGSSLTLRYGIYWDSNKNPHCPSCKNPVSKYDSFGMNTEKGYWCDSCGIQSNLADYSGKSVTPGKAVRSLSWWKI